METTRSAALLRMARTFAARRAEGAEEGAEGGFTLIELMVVLLIMAILLAIAIPTFLGVKSGAQTRAVQSDLTNAITAAKAIYTNQGSYGTVASTLVTTLGQTEPELHFTTGSASSSANGGHQISLAVDTVSGLILVMAEQAASGRCWYVEDNENSTVLGALPAPFSANANSATTAQGISYASGPGVGGVCTAGTDVPSQVTGSYWFSSYPAS